jgi:hypothetical protein
MSDEAVGLPWLQRALREEDGASYRSAAGGFHAEMPCDRRRPPS